MRRLLAALAAAAGLALAGPAVAPASAAPDGCTGVWVVVDATAAGGEVTTACAPAHTTGTEALGSAGFDVARQAGMVCRVAGVPERCEVSTTAYWSYWQSTPDGTGYGEWIYASLGPDSTKPAGGAAEGWVFGDGRTPPAGPPTELATPGAEPAPAEPAPAMPSAAPETPGAGLSGPLGIAVVAGGVAVAAGAVWLARRRAA